MDEVNKALYALFQCRDIADVAIDVYWGNHNHFEEEEIEAFEAKDYNEAYHLACLEMIERVRYGNDFPYKNPEDPADEKDTSFDEMIGDLGDLYGKHLRLIQTNKSLSDKGNVSVKADDFMNRRLDDLESEGELMTRAVTPLRKAGFSTLAEVYKTPRWEVRKLPGLGNKAISYLAGIAVEKGIKWE